MLSDIAYNPRIVSIHQQSGEIYEITRTRNHLAKLIMKYLAESKWVSVYGLSYQETMKLPYAEWVYMQQQLELLTQNQIGEQQSES